MTAIWQPRGGQGLVLPKLTTYGHSYRAGGALSGTLAQQQANRATGKLAPLLGVPSSVEIANNFAVGGAALMRQDQTQSNAGGAWTQAQTSGGYMPFLNQGLITRAGAPYLSPLAAAVIQQGVNDIMYFGPANAAFLAAWRAVLECCVSRARAASVYDDTSGTINYSIQWASFANNSNVGTGTGAHTDTVNGETVTINVPASFEGGTVAFSVLAGQGQYCTWSVQVDGVARPDLQFTSQIINGYSVAGSDFYRPMCRRIQGLSAGAHTIVLTVSAISVIAFFDSWWIEANPAPFILIADQNLPLDYSAYSSPPYRPTDTDVSALNAANRQVAALFTDGRVFTDGGEALIPRTAGYWQADHLHPNERAEALLAGLWLKTLAAKLAGVTDLGALATA